MSQATESVARNAAFHSQLVDTEAAHYAMQWQKIARIANVLRRFAQRSSALADVGAFTGLATLQYAEACAATEVWCLDLSEAALHRAAERGFKTALWNCEEPSPAAEASFSVIVAADVIEHLVNTDGFIEECRRMLKRHGVLVISTPNLAYWLNRLRLARGWVPWSYPGVSSTFRRSDTVDRNHIRISTPAEWLGFFEHAGFEILYRTGYSIFRAAATDRWGRARTWLDEKADDYAADLAFGNIFCLRRID